MPATRTAKLTKKAFREHLNAQPELNSRQDKRGGLTGARTRLYGDWLYSADKPMFDELYRQHHAITLQTKDAT